MVSFVYLAVGELRDIQIFKIGKTNRPKQRIAALHMRFASHIACIDEIEALELEALLLAKTRAVGAHSLPNRKEWFRYSETVYRKVYSWFENDSDELVAQVVYKAQVKRDQLAKKAAAFDTVKSSSTSQASSSSETFRHQSSPPNPITLDEMQAVIDRQRAQITQFEQSARISSKRRESYLLTIEVLQDEVRALRRELMEVQAEQEKSIKQLQEQHEREINTLMIQIHELLKQVGQVS
ncbi:MAG: GIY-YIG nuclease family protein [Anaerolinea sp.]|nr:GIY-YIG nuclease family protein [Anaerolinea sp.]